MHGTLLTMFCLAMCMHGLLSIAPFVHSHLSKCKSAIAYAHLIAMFAQYAAPCLSIGHLLRPCCKHNAGRVTRLECAALPAVQSRSTVCSLAVMMNMLDCGTAENSRVRWLRSAAVLLLPACILLLPSSWQESCCQRAMKCTGSDDSKSKYKTHQQKRHIVHCCSSIASAQQFTDLNGLVGSLAAPILV